MSEQASPRDRPGALGEAVQALGDIASRQHVYLRRMIARLLEQTIRLDERNAATQPAVRELRHSLADFSVQLQGHVAKEENLLFPALQALALAERDGTIHPALPFPTMLNPVRLLEGEHIRIEAALARIRRAIEGTAVPEAEREAWRRLVAGFSQLEADLREHHRSENEELFPLALELEARLP